MELIELAQSVAKILGLTVETSEESPNWVSLNDASRDVSIRMTDAQGWTRKSGRISIYGALPRRVRDRKYYATTKNEITLASTSTPEKVAREIERRVMPVYIETLTKALAWEQATLRDEATIERISKRALEIPGAYRAYSGEIYFNNPSCVAKISGDGSVRLERLELTEAQLFQMLAMFRDSDAAAAAE